MACVVLAAWVATALTLSGAEPLAEYELGKGWATFGLVLPSGAAREGLRIGALSTQTDIKTTWPDGSIRFAVVSAQIPRSGRYPVTVGPRASGTFEPSLPAAAVDIVIDGSTHSATLPTTLTDLWLDGPNVREGRAVLSFSGATGRSSAR